MDKPHTLIMNGTVIPILMQEITIHHNSDSKTAETQYGEVTLSKTIKLVEIDIK